MKLPLLSYSENMNLTCAAVGNLAAVHRCLAVAFG